MAPMRRNSFDCEAGIVKAYRVKKRKVVDLIEGGNDASRWTELPIHVDGGNNLTEAIMNAYKYTHNVK